MGVGVLIAALCAVVAIPLMTTLAPEVRCAAARLCAPRTRLGTRRARAGRETQRRLLARDCCLRLRGCLRGGARSDGVCLRLLASRQLMSEVSVGIDLGTTFSVVAVCQHGQVSVVEARAQSLGGVRGARGCELTRRPAG